MYHNDHPPAHFHAVYAEFRAVIELETLAIVRGRLPRPKAHAVVKWATSRRSELLIAWNRTQANLPTRTIE